MTHLKFRLGKKPARHDPRTLCLAKYLKALPPAPVNIDWTQKMAFPCGMMLNDQLGDCTCAGIGHLRQLLTANAQTAELTMADADILNIYEQACGYNPGDPGTDLGGYLLDLLTFWKNTGVGLDGNKIAAFASVNVLNQAEVMQALNLFGGLYTGVMLPVSAQQQVGDVWDVVATPDGAPNSWGGHCVAIGEGDANHLTCLTWGARQLLTWAFWNRYFDEAYAVVTQEWIEANGDSPSGFDLATLLADVALLT